MRAILTKLNAWFTPIRRHPWLASGFFVCLLVVGVLAFAGFAHAEDFITGVFNGLLRFFVQILLAMARFCIGMTIFFLRFFIELSAYNGYIDTPTVVIGWLLVRDVANMFFVVVLLIIAFGTILGIEQYEWKKTMGHFLLAAIFINFSKTICGLIIDVAHVFTMTFLNAVSAAAGGNLITLFNFDKLLSFIRAPNVGDTSQGLELDLAIAGVAAFLFAFLALWTIGAYLIIMLARVLVLWILIILSPIAYILQAIPHTKSYATQWWSKFMKQVMVAPVMVFFFWLAFATLGSGNIASQQLGLDIEQTAGAAGAGSVLSEASDPTPSASILEGTTWENMANFFIAAGMLWVGLMVVGQMGVVAGGMTQSVMSAAKKVAGYATGYVVGRFLYEKGLGGAKAATSGVLNNMPFGGRFWKRQGTAIAGQFGYVKGRLAENKAIRIAGFEKKHGALGKVWTRGMGALTGGLVGESQGRAEKRATDWKETAERQKKIVEESYSTSSTHKGGELKTRTTARLQIVEEQANVKKEQKIEEARAKLSEKIKGVEAKAKEAGLHGEEKDKFIKKSLGSADAASYDRMKVTYKTKAKVEELKYDRTKDAELREAGARDELLREKGLRPRHVNLVRQKQQKELEEQMSGLNYREVVDAAKFYAGNAVTASTAEDKAAATKNLVATVVNAMNRGSETGVAAFDEAASKIEFNEVLEANDMKGHQRKLLSIMLGRYITAAEMATQDQADSLTDEVRTMHGEEGANTMFRNINASFNHSAADGAVNLAGLVNDTYVDPGTGIIRHRLMSDADDMDGVSRFEGMRKYWAQEASSNVTKLTGIGDAVSRQQVADIDPATGTQRVDAEGRPKMKVVYKLDPASENQLAGVLGNITPTTRLHKRLIDDIKKLQTDVGAAAFNNFLDTLNVQARDAITRKLDGTPPPPVPPAGTP